MRLMALQPQDLSQSMAHQEGYKDLEASAEEALERESWTPWQQKTMNQTHKK